MDRAPLYHQLRTDLLEGRFPAEELLTEKQLTERYGVSRTPVREALGRLEQDGLLVRAVRGYRICAGTPQDVIEIYDVRVVLEQTAAESAALLRTELQLAELTQLHRQAQRAGDPSTVRQLNARWHELLWAASHSATLESLLRALVQRLRVFDQDAQHRDDLAETEAEHTAVLAAVAARDPAAAREAVGAHLLRTKAERLATFAERALSREG